MTINSIPLEPLGAIGKSKKRRCHFRFIFMWKSWFFLFICCKRSWNGNQFYTYFLWNPWELLESPNNVVQHILNIDMLIDINLDKFVFNLINHYTSGNCLLIHVSSDQGLLNDINLDKLMLFSTFLQISIINCRVILASFSRENIVFYFILWKILKWQSFLYLWNPWGPLGSLENVSVIFVFRFD